MKKFLLPAIAGLAVALTLSGCVVEPGTATLSAPAQSQGRTPASASTPRPTVDPEAARQTQLLKEVEKTRLGEKVSASIAAATYRKLDYSAAGTATTAPFLYKTLDGSYIRADRWSKAIKPGEVGTFAALPDAVVQDLRTRAARIPNASESDRQSTEDGLRALQSEFERDEGTWDPRQYGDHHTLVVIIRANYNKTGGSVIAWQHRVLRPADDGTEPLKSRDNGYSEPDSRDDMVADAKTIIAAYSATELQPNRYVLLDGK